ncbi:MAG: hypothetical protein ACYS9C_08030, partial [Planctomycetota bacterium]
DRLHVQCQLGCGPRRWDVYLLWEQPTYAEPLYFHFQPGSNGRGDYELWRANVDQVYFHRECGGIRRWNVEQWRGTESLRVWWQPVRL